MKIPIHFIPWKAKAEIVRLRSKIVPLEVLNTLLTSEQNSHAQTRSELESAQKNLDSANDKIAKVNKWIILSHGLQGLRTNGSVIDILKRPQIKNEKNIQIVLPKI